MQIHLLEARVGCACLSKKKEGNDGARWWWASRSSVTETITTLVFFLNYCTLLKNEKYKSDKTDQKLVRYEPYHAIIFIT